MKTAERPATPAMMREFLYQDQYGRSSSSWVKLAALAPLGISVVVFSVPEGLKAADTMKMSGNSANARAARTPR